MGHPLEILWAADSGQEAIAHERQVYPRGTSPHPGMSDLHEIRTSPHPVSVRRPSRRRRRPGTRRTRGPDRGGRGRSRPRWRLAGGARGSSFGFGRWWSLLVCFRVAPFGLTGHTSPSCRATSVTRLARRRGASRPRTSAQFATESGGCGWRGRGPRQQAAARGWSLPASVLGRGSGAAPADRRRPPPPVRERRGPRAVRAPKKVPTTAKPPQHSSSTRRTADIMRRAGAAGADGGTASRPTPKRADRRWRLPRQVPAGRWTRSSRPWPAAHCPWPGYDATTGHHDDRPAAVSPPG